MSPDMAAWDLTEEKVPGNNGPWVIFLSGRLKFRFDGRVCSMYSPETSTSKHGRVFRCTVTLWCVSCFLVVNTFPSVFSLSAEKLLCALFPSIIPPRIHGLRLRNYCQVLASSLGNFRHFPLNENGSLGRLWKADPCGFERILCCDVVGRLARNCPFQADDAKLDIC